MSAQISDKRKNQFKKVVYAGLMLLALLLVVALLLVLRFRTKQVSVKVGDVFTSDITAPYTGTDSFLTDEARQKARESATVVYATDSALVNKYETAIGNWFTYFDGWLNDMFSVWSLDTETLENKYLFRGLNASWKDIISEAELEKALKQRGLSNEISVTVAYLILDKYIPANIAHTIGETISGADFKTAFTDAVFPLLEEGVSETALYKTQTSAKSTVKKKTLLSSLKTEVAGKLIDEYLQPTIAIDETATEENRRLAAATVSDVQIKRGEILFTKGATVTAEDITHLTSLGLLKGSGTAVAFSMPALLIYSLLSVFAYGLWLLIFEKRLILKTKALLSTVIIYMLTAVLAFVFSYIKAELVPALLALICASFDRKKEHAAGALILSVLILPVLLDTDEPFGAEAFITALSVLIGGLCCLAVLFIPKNKQSSPVIAGLFGGTVMGLVRLCPLLWTGASGLELVSGFCFPFLGGLLASILSFPVILFLKRVDSFNIRHDKE